MPNTKANFIPRITNLRTRVRDRRRMLCRVILLVRVFSISFYGRIS